MLPRATFLTALVLPLPTDTYDLGNFPRQMLKFKIGVEF